MGFKTEPAQTGRPGYHPGTLLKLFIYGYLNRIQSSRRLEKETQRNVELMWQLKRVPPDFKTIIDFKCHLIDNKESNAFNLLFFIIFNLILQQFSAVDFLVFVRDNAP